MERKVIHITKKEAAVKQLNQAIRLFFQRGDMLSVHTLAAASYQLLDDLGKLEGIKSIFRNSDKIRPEHLKEWRAALSGTQNFLKHANRDPDQTHEYVEEGTMFLLLEAVDMANRLFEMQSRERIAFEVWFCFHFPDLVRPAYLQEIQKAAKDNTADPSNLDLWYLWLTTP